MSHKMKMFMKTSVILILLISIALILIYHSFQIGDEGVERTIFGTGMVNNKTKKLNNLKYSIEGSG